MYSPITQSSDPFIQGALEKIQFRFIAQDKPAGLFDSAELSKAEGFKSVDVANTQIWDKDTVIFNLELLLTPRLSTVAIGYFINRLVAQMPPEQCYLNIGAWCGFSLFAGIVGNQDKHCIAVDNFSDPRNTRSIFLEQYRNFKGIHSDFYEMDYLDYFKTHREPIGVYFYDGDHAYEHQLRGLTEADPFLAPGSYSLVDDTNGEEPRGATNDFVESSKGRYEIVLDAKTPNNGHPTFWNGLMIIKKKL